MIIIDEWSQRTDELYKLLKAKFDMMASSTVDFSKNHREKKIMNEFDWAWGRVIA